APAISFEHRPAVTYRHVECFFTFSDDEQARRGSDQAGVCVRLFLRDFPRISQSFIAVVTNTDQCVFARRPYREVGEQFPLARRALAHVSLPIYSRFTRSLQHAGKSTDATRAG